MLFSLVVFGCSTSEPSSLCLPVTIHDGAGQVRLEGPDGELVLALETGARNLKLFDHGAPWVGPHWLGQQKAYNLWEGKQRSLVQQETLVLQQGQLELKPWRQAEPPVHWINSAWGGWVDGWAGVDVFHALGGKVTYSEGQICGTRPPSCGAPLQQKPLVTVELQSGEGTFLVDTALVRSVVWGRGDRPEAVRIAQAGQVWAWPFPSKGTMEHYGSGTAGGEPIDGVLGWADLEKSSWTWNLCTGEFEVLALPELAAMEQLTPLQVHQSNGHIP